MSLGSRTNAERVRRRIQTNTQNMADGLERFQEELLELFNSQLDAFRAEALKRDEEQLAMITTLVQEIGALKQGITGLSHQFSDLLAALEPTKDIP